jgi:hypothetical protein
MVSTMNARILGKRFLAGGLMAAVCGAALVAAPAAVAQEAPKTEAPRPEGPARRPSKFRDFADVTKDAKKYEGLFTLYHDNQNLYAVLRPSRRCRSPAAPRRPAWGSTSTSSG